MSRQSRDLSRYPSGGRSRAPNLRKPLVRLARFLVNRVHAARSGSPPRCWRSSAVPLDRLPNWGWYDSCKRCTPSSNGSVISIVCMLHQWSRYARHFRNDLQNIREPITNGVRLYRRHHAAVESRAASELMHQSPRCRRPPPALRATR